MKLSRIIRVDMTSGAVSEEEAPAKYDLLGGRALTARMAMNSFAPRPSGGRALTASTASATNNKS